MSGHYQASSKAASFFRSRSLRFPHFSSFPCLLSSPRLLLLLHRSLAPSPIESKCRAPTGQQKESSSQFPLAAGSSGESLATCMLWPLPSRLTRRPPLNVHLLHILRVISRSPTTPIGSMQRSVATPSGQNGVAFKVTGKSNSSFGAGGRLIAA